MRYTFLVPIIIGFGAIISHVHADDVIVNGVNLGSCKTYTDGCNNCSISENGVAACTMRMCIQAGTPKCLDTTATGTDTQLSDIEKNKQDAGAKTLATDFKLRSFSSCDNMESVMKGFIKDYYAAHPYGGRYLFGGGLMLDGAIMDKGVTQGITPTSIGTTAVSNPIRQESAVDVSNTNLQVA